MTKDTRYIKAGIHCPF